MNESTTKTEVTIRRAPKFPVFLILGGALGAIVTLVLTMSQPADLNIGYPTLFGYFLLFGLPAGVVLGALVAILLDMIARRTAKTVTAERTTVDN
jgi:ABC-type branched-subunit amino acid transport system permease subunit